MASERIILKFLMGVLVITFCDCFTLKQSLEIDSLVQDVFMAQNNIPGVGVTIVENFGNSLFAKVYGYADLERNTTADQNTKFCIASITETFTATLVMKVLSENFPHLGAAVLETPVRILHPNGNFTFSDSRSRYAPEVAPFRAGGFYSNTLFALAGKLIAEIARQPYEMLLQDLFDQLGMNESTLITADANLDLMVNMSRGYFLKDNEINLLNSSLINRVFVGAPSGGIITTSNDMAKYIYHISIE